jgi:hypothetical protein
MVAFPGAFAIDAGRNNRHRRGDAAFAAVK